MDNEYSYADAMEDFYADDEVSRKAKQILRKAHCDQVKQGQYKQPFVNLEHCSPEEHQILDLHFESERQRVRDRAQMDCDLAMPSPQTSGIPMVTAFAGVIEPLRRLMKRKGGGSDVNTYELMRYVLAYTPLARYNGSFYCRQDSVYRPLSDEELRLRIFTLLEPVLASGKGPRVITEVLNMLQDNPSIHVNHPTQHPDHVVFLNGAYNVLTRQLEPIGPQEFCNCYVPIYFTPSSYGCPVFDNFIHTISGGDPATKELILECIGYLLVPEDTRAKAFFVLYGAGDTGKSVFGSLMASFFNEDVVSFLTIDRFRGQFTTSVLKGKHLNLCLDLPQTAIGREAVAVIKLITGDDVITIEEKYKNAEAYKPTCKLLFGTNFPLMLTNNDPAFNNRMVVIPFPHPIPKDQQDKQLLDKLKTERPAIAVKVLDAYLRLRRHNYVFPSIEGCQPLAGYIDDSELMDGFLCECCALVPAGFAFTTDLMERYNMYRAERQLPPLTDSAGFSRQLNRFCAGKISGSKRRRDGKPQNGYVGIIIKT